MIFNLFKRKKEIRNCHHEDFAHLVEKAFVGAGVHSKKTQYYRFKGNTELDMIAGRYNIATKFFIEATMRINSQDLLYYIEKIEESVNRNEIKISELGKWTSIIKDRTNLLVENKTAMKLASASYFDESEVLDGYDYSYNMKKIKAWEDSGDYSFFFTKPMSDLLPLPESWQKDSGAMKNYLELVETDIKSRTGKTSE